jgi:hypothetical protein
MSIAIRELQVCSCVAPSLTAGPAAPDPGRRSHSRVRAQRGSLPSLSHFTVSGSRFLQSGGQVSACIWPKKRVVRLGAQTKGSSSLHLKSLKATVQLLAFLYTRYNHNLNSDRLTVIDIASVRTTQKAPIPNIFFCFELYCCDDWLKTADLQPYLITAIVGKRFVFLIRSDTL